MLQSRTRPPAGLSRAVRTWLALIAGCLAFAAVAAPAARAATPYYVDGASTAGRCSNSYTAAQTQSPLTPWCTISEAVASVPSGATIDVAPAVYHERVTLTPQDDGVTLQGTGLVRPVIDGGWSSSTGIQLVNGVHNVTIDGFDIRDLLSGSSQNYAAGIAGTDTASDTIENNVIHAVHGTGPYAYGLILGNNNSPGLVHNIDVRANHIYDIGPGGESMGIWLLMTTGMTVEDNEIYLVRKEGIRDWYGLDNTFTGNRLYLNWVGITLESAVGDLVDNNVSYANVWGYNPKHVSDADALSKWGLSTGQWSRFWHNTAFGNTHADIALGMNAPNDDYIDIRDNVFASPGDVHIHDFPAVRDSHLIVDYNVYSGSAPIYYTTWHAPHPDTYSSLAALQAALGWELHGQVLSPRFQNPAAGDFTFSASGMAPGVSLPDGFGAQLGAANVPAATSSWTRYATTVVASTPEPSFLSPAGAGDGRDDSYWWSSGYSTNASVTFDMGVPEPVNTFVLDLFAHEDPRNPRGYSIQVSNDNTDYRTVLAGENPDAEGSSYKYTLSTPVTARYVRLNLLSSFGGSTLIFSDFAIGLLAPTSSPAAAPQATANAASIAGRATPSGKGSCTTRPPHPAARRKLRTTRVRHGAARPRSHARHVRSDARRHAKHRRSARTAHRKRARAHDPRCRAGARRSKVRHGHPLRSRRRATAHTKARRHRPRVWRTSKTSR